MPASKHRLRVALVSTAALGQPGSMRAYADTLVQALARHAPEIELDLIELDPMPKHGVWSRRLQTVLMPARAWLQRSRAPDLWHVLDGSRAYVAGALGPALRESSHSSVSCGSMSGSWCTKPSMNT